MNSKYFFGILISVILILSNQFLIQYILNENREDARLINIAGRQRMLSQKLTLELHKIHNGDGNTEDLKGYFQEWNTQHTALLHGSNKLQISKVSDKKVVSTLNALTKFIENANSIISKAETESADLKLLDENQRAFLLKMEQVVKLLENDSNHKLMLLTFAEIILAIVSIIVLIIEVIFIYRPISLKLEASEKQYRHLVNNTGDIIYSSSIRGIFSFVSPACRRLLGYAEEEIEGNSFTEFVHPEDISYCSEFSQKIFRTGEPQEGMEYRVRHKNGHWVWHASNGAPQKDSSGKIVGFDWVARDITESKMMQLQIIEAKEKAEAASLAKSEFLANMSHEIRTPLNSIIGFSELLIQAKLNSAQKDYIQSVNYSANVLLSLINDILDFSKIEASKLDLEEERTDLHELLYRVVDVAKFDLKEKDIELLLYIAPDVPRYVFTDVVRLRQILVNLVGNAMKFTEEGEIEISLVRSEKAEHDKTAVLKFEVRDTGIGISEAKQKYIFDAFSQEDTSTTRSYGGTGLGLAISNQLLALMNSQMQLVSEQGKGSSFSFIIEVIYDIEQPLHESSFDNIRSVLLADSTPRSIEIVQSILLGKGIETETVSTITEILDKLQSPQSYDVALLDFKTLSGGEEEARNRIKEKLQLISDKLPVLIISNFLNEEESKRIADTYTARGFLHKPITQRELHRSFSLLNGSTTEKLNEKEANAVQDMSVSFNGKAVLIVDDNSINRKLAVSMLNKLFKDIKIIEAENGKRALESERIHEFEIILMDIQMPDMSGYEVTKHIRESEGKKSRVVIIALTAGIIKGERERCIAAGMNDYMSKPVTLDKLKDMIKKWTDHNKENSPGKSCKESEHSAVADFNYEAFLEGLDNDTDSAEEIIEIIREGSLRDEVMKLNRAFSQQGKEDKIRFITHKIRGICLNLRFEKLGEEISQFGKLKPHYYSSKGSLLLKQINEKYKVVEKIISGKEYL